MAILPPPLSGTSAVRNQFLAPLHMVYQQATTVRQCPAQTDWDWLTKGMDRVVSSVRSGRDYEIEYRLRGREGGYRWFLIRGVQVRGELEEEMAFVLREFDDSIVA